MSTLKPIIVYGQGGPNPPKVAMILAEIGLPHTIEAIQFDKVKDPYYTAINPNGRLPSIHDPNASPPLTLWESGAIVEYLIETYDTDHKISFPKGTNEAYLAKQWSYFQASGQGPYYGQFIWFKKFAPEDVPLAKTRYSNEIARVTGVLEKWLTKQTEEYGDDETKKSKGPWLVGNKCSYADIVFFMWQFMASIMLSADEFDSEKFPAVKDWLARLKELKVVKEAAEATEAQMKGNAAH